MIVKSTQFSQTLLRSIKNGRQKLKTIRKKIKQGKKLGFSERARAVNKGLLPSKAKKKK